MATDQDSATRSGGSTNGPANTYTFGMTYSSSYIYKFAARLYRTAQLIVFFCTLIGLAVGGASGYMGARGRWADEQLFAVIGALIGGAIGLAIGVERAFWLKLQAQVALCQVRIEENTRNSRA